MTLAAMALGLALTGGGRFSADAVIWRKQFGVRGSTFGWASS